MLLVTLVLFLLYACWCNVLLLWSDNPSKIYVYKRNWFLFTYLMKVDWTEKVTLNKYKINQQ